MILLLFTISLVYLIGNAILKWGKYPKGPFPYPIVGNLPQLWIQCNKYGSIVHALKHFQKKYGDVFTLWLGPFPTVYVCSYELSHETMIKQSHLFSTRGAPGIMNEFRNGRGIIASNGDFWTEHRRFAMKTLRDFGVGKNIMEMRILEELQQRLDDLKVENNEEAKTFHAPRFFDLLVGSIINRILTSERFGKDREEEFLKIKDALEYAQRAFSFFDLFVPVWLQKSFIFSWRHNQMKKPLGNIITFVTGEIDRRLAKIEAGEHEIGDEGEDFIDSTLIKKRQDERNGIETTFTRENLIVDMYDLWLAGQETTSTTLCWATNCLVNDLEVQRKCREEIRSVTGGDRYLSYADRTSTPYLNATVAEVQRIASIISLNLLRITTEESVINGQRCAAGAIIAAQPSLIHIDEGLFKDHKKFDPTRFLHKEKLAQQTIPFGIGKRVCLGEGLARAELYLILGNILQNYTIKCIGKRPILQTTSPFGVMKRHEFCDIQLVPV